MTDTILGQIIQKQIEEVFAQNQDAILDSLANGIGNETMPVMEVAVRLTKNSIRLSVLMAVQMTLRILENADVIDLDGNFGPLLEVIIGGKERGDE